MKVLYKNAPAIIKIPSTKELRQKIQIEAEWARFINSQSLSEKLNIRCPNVIALNEKYLLSEWIEAPLLDDNSSDDVSSCQVDGIVKILKLILDLPADGFEPQQKISWSPEKIIDSIYDHAQHVEPSLCTDIELKRAIAIIDKYRGDLPFGLSHGDMGPWQIFKNKEELILFDGEHASRNLPRLKDTANAFMRLFTKRRNANGLGQMLKSVQDHLSIEDDQFTAELLPMLIKWSLIGLVDAQKDVQFGKIVTHQDKARQLFDACLAEDISALKNI